VTEAFLLPQVLGRSAARRPHHVALDTGDASLTYRELDERSNRVARLLLRHDVRRGDRVGVHLEKGIDHMVVMWGVLKAGAVYVPLDARAPGRWLAQAAGHLQFALIVTNDRGSRAWREVTEPPDVLEIGQMDLVADAGEEPPVHAVDLDPVAIFLTSGSTGAPRGVIRTHRNVLAGARGDITLARLRPADRLGCNAPLHFSFAARDVFCAAILGATLVLPPDTIARFPVDAVDFAAVTSMTVWSLVPSLLAGVAASHQADRTRLSDLRSIQFGGEMPTLRPVLDLMAALPGVAFDNCYGSTETNRVAAYRLPRRLSPTIEVLPIGRPASNVDLLIADDDGRPAEMGQLGELYVRGTCVTPGYWRDESATAKALVPHPFAGPEAGRVFRTGDLASIDEKGLVSVWGRRAGFLKARGYRIEPAQVENALLSHPDVAECAVVVKGDRLLGFVGTDVAVTSMELRRWCGARLPRYLVPAHIEVLTALPRTDRGKIDRRQLERSAADP
jgi:amino acid adenylation domain-containing protein